MSRFDVYQVPDLDGYVVEVQADLLSHLATTVVVPLLPEQNAPRPMSRVNPVLLVQGSPYVLVAQSVSAVPRRELGPHVAALDGQAQYEVGNALDFLLTGV